MISPQYVDGLEQRIKELTAERDALAAHVEQANLQVDAYRKVEGSPLYLAHRIGKWRDESPETSLARLIAEKQAKAFDELAGDLALNADNARENGYTAAADVMQDAADYALTKAEMRRQAGGDA